MDSALLVARLILAAVFVVAALAKLGDAPGSRQALRDFGVPSALAAPFGVLLPLAELATAIALLFARTAWWGGLAALVLLALFIVGIGVTLARGRRPACHCFGQLSSGSIDASTLVRNVVLALVAAFVVGARFLPNPAADQYSAVAWIGHLQPAAATGLVLGLLGLLILAAEAGVLFQLLGRHGQFVLQLEALQGQIGYLAAAAGSAAPGAYVPAPVPPAAGLPLGVAAPNFRLSGMYGETQTLEALRAAAKPVLLAFTDPNCGPCNALLPDLARWQRELAGSLSLVLISQGTVEANQSKSAEYGLSPVLLQQGREVMEAYQVAGTPSAVLVRPEGTIGSPLAQGTEEIRALVARQAMPGAPLFQPPALQAPAPVPQVPAGPLQRLATRRPAPALRLPDLSGKDVDLAEYRGRETALLWWNPGCGFCQQLMPQFKAWEANRPPNAPEVLLVSTGTVDANREQGLASTMLLEPSFNIGSAFGVGGTPSAVLVDADGNISTEVAVGGPAVMALLNNEALPAAAAPSDNGNCGAPAAPSAQIGTSAPDFSLPDVNGKNVALADFRGKRTMLLFWNPGCGFCQQMLQDLRQWEVQRPSESPEILIVSTGAAQENRAMGLRSPLLLDAGMSVGAKFGANGTPMGVLIDAEGKVASEVAAGAQAVLSLARGN